MRFLAWLIGTPGHQELHRGGAVVAHRLWNDRLVDFDLSDKFRQGPLMKRSAATIMAQPGATAFSATARSQAKSLSIKTAEAKGVSAPQRHKLEVGDLAVGHRRGPASRRTSSASISRWSIANIAKAPERPGEDG